MELSFPLRISLQLQGYTDSDQEANPNDRKSVGSYCFLIGKIVVFWRFKKQSRVSRSSTETEYKALADAFCEVIWLKDFSSNLEVGINGQAFAL